MTEAITPDAVARAVERRLEAWIPPREHLRRPDSERLILGAILAQQSRGELPHLTREMFSCGQHGWTWELTEGGVDYPKLAKELMAKGYSDAALYLAEMTPNQWDPQPTIVELVEAAAEIRKMWWARKWHTVLTRLDLLVCAGATTQEALLEELRVAAKETKL